VTCCITLLCRHFGEGEEIGPFTEAHWRLFPSRCGKLSADSSGHGLWRSPAAAPFQPCWPYNVCTRSAVHALAVSLDLPAPFLTVAPPPAVAGPCTHAGVLGMYATSGCCVTGTDSRTGEMQDCQGTGSTSPFNRSISTERRSVLARSRALFSLKTGPSGTTGPEGQQLKENQGMLLYRFLGRLHTTSTFLMHNRYSSPWYRVRRPPATGSWRRLRLSLLLDLLPHLLRRSSRSMRPRAHAGVVNPSVSSIPLTPVHSPFSLHPGCWAAPSGQAAAASGGAPGLVYHAAPPGPPAQTAAPICRQSVG
jgi:hypothetical protein